MTKAFELFLNKEQVSEEDFLSLYTTATGYLGNFSKLRLHMILAKGHVRYYIESDKDLSALSSNLTFCVLKPVANEEVKLPVHTKKSDLLTS